MKAPACFQVFFSECARPRAQQLPQILPGGNHAAAPLQRESLWPGTATLRLLKT